MAKDIKDYLHLYLGCDVQYPDTDRKLMVAKFTGFSRADGIETTYKKKRKAGKAVGDYLSWKPNGHHNCDANHLKPILRKLSSITEEECDNLDWYYRGTNGGLIEHRAIDLTPEQVRYLLSRGFDLFGLIDLGLAIEKK